LFDRIRKTMPQSKPGRLTRQQDADVLAFLLNINKFPAGKTELYRQSEMLKEIDRKSTRLNSSHVSISYAVFCLKKKKTIKPSYHREIPRASAQIGRTGPRCPSDGTSMSLRARIHDLHIWLCMVSGRLRTS